MNCSFIQLICVHLFNCPSFQIICVHLFNCPSIQLTCVHLFNLFVSVLTNPPFWRSSSTWRRRSSRRTLQGWSRSSAHLVRPPCPSIQLSIYSTVHLFNLFVSIYSTDLCPSLQIHPCEDRVAPGKSSCTWQRRSSRRNPRGFMSHNGLIRWFWKVNSPTKSAPYRFNW